MNIIEPVSFSPRTKKQEDEQVPPVNTASRLPKLSPFLRWAGGKSKLRKHIIPHVPVTFHSYHEPFLGSGALYFAVIDRAKGPSFLSDLNEHLINTWVCVRDHPHAFLKGLECYKGCNSEDHYYRIRAERPSEPILRAARFFYLNQTAWNGLWRENRWGVFNVPWGARPFRGIQEHELFAISAAISNARIRCTDFRDSMRYPVRGDMVYLDPPYLPISDTSKFSGYNGKRFRFSDLEALAELTVDLDARGVKWIMSNRDNPSVRSLFNHARIVHFTTRRSVSAQNKRNIQPVQSPEVLIIGERCGT